MSANDTACATDDRLCITVQHQVALIVVPAVLLAGTLLTLAAIFILLYCPTPRSRRVAAPQRYHNSFHAHQNHQQKRQDQQNHRQKNRRPQQNRRPLHGIDAPPGIDPLEHEQLPMSVQRNVRPALAAVPAPATERHHEEFGQISALPQHDFFSSSSEGAVRLYRAKLDRRDVVLRVLNDSSSVTDQSDFLGFCRFLRSLGSHRFLPSVLGVISARPPLVLVLEELQHGNLLSFLWTCRRNPSQNSSGSVMTEQRIFVMAGQVVSALNFLHSRSCIHGNVGARSVLVGRDLRAKLWGLGPAYRRWHRRQSGDGGWRELLEDVELKKWQAPEVLTSRTITGPSADVWSFGVLLYEMVTLGDAPFAEVTATELVEHLQRGNKLQRPANCSAALDSIIGSCCRWNPAHRPSMTELSSKLQAGEAAANGRTALRAPQPINVETYLREAGYGETYNYAVL